MDAERTPALDAVAAALADPVRRTIVAMLRGGPLTAGAIASRFEITRPAISRHLRVLRESALVVSETDGRERRYHLDQQPLGELRAWLDALAAGWTSTLDALETEVHRTKRERRRRSATPLSSEELTA